MSCLVSNIDKLVSYRRNRELLIFCTSSTKREGTTDMQPIASGGRGDPRTPFLTDVYHVSVR